MSAERDPLRRVVATRAVRGVTRVIAAARPDTMAEAASESSDVGVLVWALKQPEAIETLTLDDLLAPARLQGLRERERLLKEGGGTLRADEVAQQLQPTRQAVNRRRQLGKLLALDAGRHGSCIRHGSSGRKERSKAWNRYPRDGPPRSLDERPSSSGRAADCTGGGRSTC